MKIARTTGRLVLLLVILPIAAHADFMVTAGGANCGSCYGGTYTLNFLGNNAGNTFTVTLSITTPSDLKSVVAGNYISGVNIGDGKKIASVTLVSTTAGGSWSNVLGSLSSGGACDGSSGNKVCTLHLPPFSLVLANGSTYSWIWIVTFSTPGLNTNPEDVQIGAQYQDGDGCQHVVSEKGTAMPEPPTAAALTVGLAMLAFKLRRTK